MKAAFSCHLLSTLFCISFGTIYLFRSTFMPYHGEAVEMQWSELEPATRVLFLSSMKLIGGMWIANGVAMAILLLIPFRQGLRWAYWAIPAVGFIAASSALYATIHVGQHTPATPPWIFPVGCIALLASGLFLSLQPPHDR